MSTLVNVLSLETVSTLDAADEAVRIWKNRPNVINRRLCGCSEIWALRKDRHEQEDSELDCNEFVDTVVKTLLENFPEISIEELYELKTVLNTLWGESFPTQGKEREIKYTINLSEIVLRKLLPRSLRKFKITVEIIVSFEKFCPGKEIYHLFNLYYLYY